MVSLPAFHNKPFFKDGPQIQINLILSMWLKCSDESEDCNSAIRHEEYSKNNASFLLKMMFAGIVQKKVGTLSVYTYKVEGQIHFSLG